MISGGEDLARRLEQIGATVPTRIRADVLPALAGELLEQAQSLVPVRTGELRDSGFVEVGADGVEVGFSAPHALTIHERTDLPHQQGEAKFLERPLLAAQPELEARLTRALEDAL